MSDFVNKNEDVIRFFRFLDERTPSQLETLTKEKIFARLYPGKPYKDLRVRHLIWMTTDLLEDFIVFIGLEQQHALRDQLLARYFSDKEMDRFARQSLESGIAASEALPLRNDTFYIEQYHLHSLYYQVNSRNDRSREFNLQQVIDNVTVFSVIETLKYACIVQSLRKISSLEIGIPLLGPVTAMLEGGSVLLEVPAVRIYYHIYRVVSSEDEAAFGAFLEDIRAHETQFLPHDLRDLYLLAINFCIKRSNQNMEAYTRQAFDLYRYAVGKGYLLESGSISRFSFTNVVTLGIKLREFDETEQFVKKYAGQIAQEYRANTIDFNTAKLLFSQQQYKKALRILLTNEFQDTIWNLNAKYILLKIFWESDDAESFDNQLRAFKLLVRRRGNVGYHKSYFGQVAHALSVLQDVRKRPGRYREFDFAPETPDLDWFRKAIEKARK